jgi:hypothetical protein
VNATVLWFDASSGEGVVQTDEGELLYLHYTCLLGWDKNNYLAPAAQDLARYPNGLAGLRCKVTVYENLYSRQVETCELGGK